MSTPVTAPPTVSFTKQMAWVKVSVPLQNSFKSNFSSAMVVYFKKWTCCLLTTPDKVAKCSGKVCFERVVDAEIFKQTSMDEEEHPAWKYFLVAVLTFLNQRSVTRDCVQFFACVFLYTG